jgi:nitrogen regulatory protein PII
MKKMEVVMANLALDAFTQSAAELGIAEFEVAKVRRFNRRGVERQRLYRGNSFACELVERTKVEFAVFDEDVNWIVHALIGALHPESVAIFKLDQTISLNPGASVPEATCVTRKNARDRKL